MDIYAIVTEKIINLLEKRPSYHGLLTR